MSVKLVGHSQIQHTAINFSESTGARYSRQESEKVRIRYWENVKQMIARDEGFNTNTDTQANM